MCKTNQLELYAQETQRGSPRHAHLFAAITHAAACDANLPTYAGMDTSCVDAGFTECCVRDESQTCQLESGCFCDRSCYSMDQCCDDISVVCQPGTFSWLVSNMDSMSVFKCVYDNMCC